MKQYLSWEEIYQRVEKIINECPEDAKFYGVPRGGQIVAGLTNRAVDINRRSRHYY